MSNSTRRRRRRKSGRRHRGRIIVYSLVCIVAIAVVVVAAVTVFFKITKIEVTGDTRYSPSDIVTTSGITVGDNMFAINKFNAIKHIQNAYPYIDQVRISRDLPDTLVIAVSDSVPLLLIEDGESRWLADEDGKLLEQVNSDTISTNNLISVKGMQFLDPVAGTIAKNNGEDRLKPLFEILHQAKIDDILNKISVIDVDKLYEITFFYDGRFTVKLGTTEELERKFRFLLSVMQRLLPSDRGTIDITDSSTVYFIPDTDPQIANDPPPADVPDDSAGLEPVMPEVPDA